MAMGKCRTCGVVSSKGTDPCPAELEECMSPEIVVGQIDITAWVHHLHWLADGVGNGTFQLSNTAEWLDVDEAQRLVVIHYTDVRKICDKLEPNVIDEVLC